MKMEKDALIINGKKYNQCWEYWDCPKDFQKKCSVYKAKDGTRCWIYTDNLKVFDWARPKRKFESCVKCPWYNAIKSRGIKP